jgi:two-component system sensor histidine kinase RegB
MDGALPDRGSSRINLSWLVRLRWGAVAGQLCTVAVVELFMDIRLPLLPLLSLIALEALTNLLCLWRLRRDTPVTAGLPAAIMALDVLILTGLLSQSGGSYNPFSFLYLVNIALAAVVLQSPWTWALLLLAALCSGLLFSGGALLPSAASDASSHALHMQMHLQGMWIAFLVAAVFIVYFVSRVRRALDERERDLASERAAAARNERLTSLATLAAGAAHELATPLGTIATVARELDRHLHAAAGDAEAIADVGLIREQVERCRIILDQMSVDAGSPRADAPRPLEVAALFEAALANLGQRERVAAEIDPAAAGFVFHGPLRALGQALRGALKNALEASPGEAPVRLRATVVARELHVEVIDTGSGMSADVLARASEPFFTTKEPGKGMGLGLFLARTVLERLGGSMRLQSAPRTGTRVLLTLPEAAATIRRMGTEATAG